MKLRSGMSRQRLTFSIAGVYFFALRANVVHPVPAAVFSEYSVSTVGGRPLSTARNTPTPQNARRLRPTAPSNPKLALCLISHGA